MPDGDAALWTGVYGYTEALRYEATGEYAGLDWLEGSNNDMAHGLISATD